MDLDKKKLKELKELKEKFMTLLKQDREIQNCIREIIRNAGISDKSPTTTVAPNNQAVYQIQAMQKEINALRDSLANLKAENTQMNNRLSVKEQELSDTHRRSLIIQEENQSLKKHNKDLQSSIDNYVSQFNQQSAKRKELENTVTSLTDNYNNLKRRNNNTESDNINLKRKLDVCIEKFGNISLYFEKYQNLSSNTRQYLRRFISDKNEVAFLISATAPENLGRLWDYTKSMYLSDSIKEAEILKELFYYCFSMFNDSCINPEYQLDNTARGDKFDDEKHAKGTNSKSSGIIREVILQGYCSANTGNFIRHTVVIV